MIQLIVTIVIIMRTTIIIGKVGYSNNNKYNHTNGDQRSSTVFPTFFFHFLFNNEINIRAEENLVNEWNIKKKKEKYDSILIHNVTSD